MNDDGACDSTWFAPIQVVHEGRAHNPQHLAQPELIRGCHQAHGVTDGADLARRRAEKAGKTLPALPSATP